MRKQLYLILILFGSVLAGHSQSLVVHSYDEFVSVNSMNGDYFYHGAIVTNTSSTAIDVKVKRHIYSACAVDSTHFDWDFCCMPVTLNESIGYLEIEAGDSNTAFGAGCYGSSSGVSCTDSIRYTFYDENNINDSTSVVFKYIAGPDIGINEQQALKPNIYPNPATDWLNIAFSKPLTKGTELHVYDGMGQEVLTQKLVETQTQLSTKTFPTGLYVFSILQDGQDVSRQKVYIQH